ncbi:fibrohexamerin-like [Plodia interpunctella]|uniref:fibrohexamerin-like n=1 Tax=Plodia interpunctella TaxID=58824 RepID=UPI002367F0F2|nr:fibrohexamerin-like [Plodia interpunctella]
MLAKVLCFAITASLAYAGSQNIVRPCRLNDLRCLGDNFAANSKCSRNVAGRISPQYVVDEFEFETPYFNSSYIDKNLIVRNHDKCFVSEFFFNIQSDTSVITIDCPGLELQTQRTLIRHQTALEDEYFHFNYRASYPLVRLTMNIKHADSMQVCSAYTFADVTTLPNIFVEPTDKPTERFLSTDLSYLNIYERENFLYRAGPLIKIFINSYICNFGCI